MSDSELINQWLKQEQWDRFPENLYAPIGYTLDAGGKHLRPQLLIMAVRLFGCTIDDSVRSAALAVELFHNFTLLHDDVMDAAPIRRGRPTVHVRWNNNVAILSGDQMMIEAYKRLQGVNRLQLPEVLTLFSQMASGVCEGQQLDMDLEATPLHQLNTPDAINLYLQMIERKTAVLIAYALRIGATIANAPDNDARALYDFGRAIGLAFQLRDDLLDVYGNPDTFGKQIGGDIAEGKKTYLLLSAYINGNDTQRTELCDTLYNNSLTPTDKYNKVRTVYDQLLIPDLTQQLIDRYTQDALNALLQVDVPDSKKQPLRDLAAKMTQRLW